MSNDLTLKQRLITLLFYFFILVFISGFVTDIWFPKGGGKSLWFYSAIGLLFFTRLSSSFFIKPRDSLASSVTVALLLATVDLTPVTYLNLEFNYFRWATVVLAIITALSALTAIYLFQSDTKANNYKPVISRIAFRISERFGSGQVLFTPPVLLSILGFYQDNIIQQLWLIFIWSILLFVEPIDLIFLLSKDISKLKKEDVPDLVIGKIQRIDDPQIIRVKLDSSGIWKSKHAHIACLADSSQVEVLPLFFQTQGDSLIGTGLFDYTKVENIKDAISGFVYQTEKTRKCDEIISEFCGNNSSADLIGIVVEGSNISSIRFEVASNNQLQEGLLVFVCQGKKIIYYQIVDAITEEETFSKNPRGKHIAIAGQLGEFDSEKGFVKYGWLPFMNTPVFLPQGKVKSIKKSKLVDDEMEIGTIPNTKIPIIISLKDMLEYHTALLGVTGTGKTELTFDIIKNQIKRGIKVVCVDFTGEYLPRLSDLKPTTLGLNDSQSEELQDRIFNVETGDFSAGKEKIELKKLIDEFKPEIKKQTDNFLENEDFNLAIFQLESIANTQATLRLTELYLSSIFNWAKKKRKQKNILLVLEEAHTIIPETNLYGYDKSGTNAVVGRMAQIALQGRKYGVGLLLISQRTALVSKTLLSQCNTVLSFTMYDETGLKYLSNVFSTDYVRAIPNLKFLQCIALGKAVKSDRPIIFEIPYDKLKLKASEELNKEKIVDKKELILPKEESHENNSDDSLNKLNK
jgi:hypothetical protein